MGVVHGVLGQITGKVGGFVFSVLKGQQIIKEKVIPANPQTAKQTEVRTIFRKLIYQFKQVAQTWVQLFWNPFAIGRKTGWGNILKENLLLQDSVYDPSLLVVSKGSLEGISALAATYDTLTGTVVVTWDDTVYSNGTPGDLVAFLATLEDEEDVQFDTIGADDRSRITASLVLPLGFSATNVRIHIAAYRKNSITEVVEIISNSQSVLCTAV